MIRKKMMLWSLKHISPTFGHVAAPAHERWSCPEQRPAPREGTAADGVPVLEPKVSQGSADHDVPLEGQDGQGPQPHDTWGEKESLCLRNRLSCGSAAQAGM